MAEFFKAVRRAFAKHRTAGIILLVLAVVMAFALSLFEQWFQNVVMDLMGDHAHAVLSWMLSHPAGASVVIVAGFAALCLFIATRDEWIRKFAEFMREPDIASLNIIWHPGETVFVHHYKLPPDPIENTEFRVCVKNTSQRTTLRGIRVRLENLDPHNLPCAPCCLRLMNNTTPPLLERFDLDPDEDQFVTVFVQKPNASQLWFMHITPGIPWDVPAQPYSFDIVARSGPTRAKQRFHLFPNGPHWNMRAI